MISWHTFVRRMIGEILYALNTIRGKIGYISLISILSIIFLTNRSYLPTVVVYNVLRFPPNAPVFMKEGTSPTHNIK